MMTLAVGELSLLLKSKIRAYKRCNSYNVLVQPQNGPSHQVRTLRKSTARVIVSWPQGCYLISTGHLKFCFQLDMVVFFVVT